MPDSLLPVPERRTPQNFLKMITGILLNPGNSVKVDQEKGEKNA